MSAAPQLAIVPRSFAPRDQEQWISTEQAMQLTDWTDRWLREKSNAGHVVSRDSSQRSANGRPVREYLLSSLPQGAPAQAALKVVVPPVSALGPLFANLPSLNAERVTLDDPEQQKQADERYAIIEPILDFKKDPQRYRLLTLADGRQVTSLERMIKYAAASSGNSIRTIKRWLARYKSGNIAALADRVRSDKGISRWALASEHHAELARLAAYASIHEDLPVQMTYEILRCRAEQLEVAPPSYETVRKILKNLSPAARALARNGRRGYDKIFASYIRRGYEDFEAGEIVVSDHMIHDVLVQNDTYGDKDRKLIRLRFTGLLDMRSRRFTSYAWCEEGSSRSITTVIRHHYVKWGQFRVFYCDNGKDYQKAGRGARGGCWTAEDLTAQALGVLARLDAEVKYCRPFHPQSKLIERANNTIHQRFDRRWNTYCGPTPDKRPDRCVAIAERHAKLLTAGRVEESEAPLASEFIRAAVLWIEGEYHRMTKDVEGMHDMTPLEAWEKFRWTGAPEPVDPVALVPLLMEREERIIHNGRVRLGKLSYVASDPGSSIQLHDRSGQKAIILYDPGDEQWIAATDHEGRVFAYLKPETLLRQSDDEETRASIAASMQERQGHHKRIREQVKDLERSVLATGYIPQNDQMLQLGRLPIDISEVVVHRPQPKLRPNKQAVAPASAADIAASFLEEIL